MQRADRTRRVKLHDLRILVAVADAGSISRAAEHLAISHPVVSRTISGLERTLGVRLFDRSARGVEPTIYGRALLDCGIAVFDNLRQGVQRIESLSDPASGEIRLGSTEVMMAGFIPAVVDRLARKYPKLVLHTMQDENEPLHVALRERKVDLIITRRVQARGEEFNTEMLFDDPLLIVSGPRSPWVARRKISLSELLGEPWITPVPDSVIGMLFARSFHSNGLELPKSNVISNSLALRNRLLATGRYVSILPRSMLLFGLRQPRVKILPVTLPGIDEPFELVTLKNRMLSPAADLFIKGAREMARSIAGSAQGSK
jgi:DNA-binding transcriptional LysR family regulator